MLVGILSLEHISTRMLGAAHIFLANLVSWPSVIGNQCAIILFFGCYFSLLFKDQCGLNRELKYLSGTELKPHVQE